MFSRSQILTCAAAAVLTGSTWAQMQPPAGQNPPPAGVPQTTMPGSPGPGTPGLGNPGAMSQDQQADPDSVDKDFVKSVAESSATAVQLGKLAQDKGSSDAVKEFGKRMVEANTLAGQQLKQAAAALNVPLPAEPSRKAKKAEEKLAKLSGTDFDHAYAKMTADDQKQAVKQFERESKSGKVPQVKDFAAKNLPSEQDRQKQAEGLASARIGVASREK